MSSSAGAGADVISQLDRFKESFLWAAAKGGRVEECDSLVQIGADVNWKSPEGDTPLLAACRNGHTPTALCLLGHDAEVNLVAVDGQTALHLSCRKGNEAVAEALILNGADVFARDNNGSTAFESLGAHAPAGMLRRLNTVAQRRQNRDRVGSTSTTPISTHNTSTSDTDTLRGLGNKEYRPGRRRNGNQARPTDNPDGAAGEGGRVNRRSGDRGAGEGGDHDQDGIRAGERRSIRLLRGDRGGESDRHRAVGSSRGGRGAATPDRTSGRADTQNGDGRTTFPSIASAFATTMSQRPNVEAAPLLGDRSRSASEGVGGGQEFSAEHGHVSSSDAAVQEHGVPETLSSHLRSQRASSGEAFRSSDDGEGDELSEEDTNVRLLDDVYRGPTIRHGTRHYRGDELFPETMRLLSMRDPVPHASAAISAAIASAGSPPAIDLVNSVTPDTLTSPRDSFSSSPWDGTGPDGGGGHASGGVGSGSRRGVSAVLTSRTQGDGTSTTVGLSANSSGLSSARSIRIDTQDGGERQTESLESAGLSFVGPGSTDSAEGAGGARDGGFSPLSERDVAHDHLGLIRMLWLQEKESRLAAEAKADAVNDQSARLWNELVRSQKQVLSLEEASATVREESSKLRATLRGEVVKGRSLQELEQLEKDLRKALEGVCGERDRIVQEQLAKEEQRLCVVCQENERGVLLLPCRHLCVCRGCSERRELSLCPLCRDPIAEKLVVYS